MYSLRVAVSTLWVFFGRPQPEVRALEDGPAFQVDLPEFARITQSWDANPNWNTSKPRQILDSFQRDHRDPVAGPTLEHKPEREAVDESHEQKPRASAVWSQQQFGR